MEPVVSPWVIYLLGAMNPLNASLAVLLGIVALALFVGLMLVIHHAVEEEVEAQKELKKHLKPAVIVLVILMVVNILVPSKTTVIQMLVANEVTYSRLNEGKKIVEQVYTDIIELMKDPSEDKD